MVMYCVCLLNVFCVCLVCCVCVDVLCVCSVHLNVSERPWYQENGAGRLAWNYFGTIFYLSIIVAIAVSIIITLCHIYIYIYI